MANVELKTISIDSDITFRRSVDVLNSCFGKDYGAWMKGGYYLDKGYRYHVWFPKMAYYEAGRAKAQSTTKAWINELSPDGKSIHMYSDTEVKYPEDMATIHFVFAKFPKEPYRYIGTFIKDEKTTPGDHWFRRIGTEVDLTPWK